MVTIKRGNTVIQVTNGVYENYYRQKGFAVVEDKEIDNVKEKKILKQTKEKDNEETFDELENEVEEEVEIVEGENTFNDKPVSEWTKAELTEFIKENNIKVDLSGLPKKEKANAIKKAVAEFLEDHE